jgi:hypothetical protein
MKQSENQSINMCSCNEAPEVNKGGACQIHYLGESNHGSSSCIWHLSKEVGSSESTGCYSSFSFQGCCSNIQLEAQDVCSCNEAPEQGGG